MDNKNPRVRFGAIHLNNNAILSAWSPKLGDIISAGTYVAVTGSWLIVRRFRGVRA